MISGLLRKVLRETWIQTLLFGAALLAIEGLLTLIYPEIHAELNNFITSLPFVREFIQAIVGSHIGDTISAQTLQSIVWVHPVVLAVIWAQEIIFCTRLPAGEIDRGTVDVLLSWPASRRRIFLCDVAVWLASGVCLITLGYIGHALAALVIPDEAKLPTSRLLIVLSNLFCMYIAVGGIAYFVSAMSDYRGRAIGVVFAMVVASFLLSFLAEFWSPAETLSPLGVLSYYRPAQTLATGSWPLANMATLLAVGAAGTLAACETFARRNICTL